MNHTQELGRVLGAKEHRGWASDTGMARVHIPVHILTLMKGWRKDEWKVD